ncbi:MAG: 3-beta hydroxysteroid dehydrogenase, partial [Synechococcaceae bacterium WB9_4xB_025]|nr:3-beta hydroxysteroid dehydrogenase [Synechococcaceae bacterium WB9_4xB_025]
GREQTIGGSYPVVGPKAWNTGEVVQLCERLARKEARVIRVPPALMQSMQGLVSFFEPGVNIAERLAFAEVTGGGESLDAPMEATYGAFGLDPADATTLEDYIREYYTTILKRLRDMEKDLDKDAKKKLPF